VLPAVGLNDYSGPALSISNLNSLPSVTNGYGDGSYWSGPIVRMAIGLYGTNVTAHAPIGVMKQQSTSPIFASGRNYNGLLGLGFDALSSASYYPFSVFDGWVHEKSIASNTIAFHGCSYEFTNQSWIDFGNEIPYIGCRNNVSASIIIPQKNHYTVNITEIVVGSTNIELSGNFQQFHYSILDSCTSVILVPQEIFDKFKEKLVDSNAFSNQLRSSLYFESWINGQILLSNLGRHVNYELLPNISFTLQTGRKDYETINLVLGPRQYIQKTSSGYYQVLIAGTVDFSFIILVLPFFSAFHIVVDRDLGTLNFQLGCGCAESDDGYPWIQRIFANKTLFEESGHSPVITSTNTELSYDTATATLNKITSTRQSTRNAPTVFKSSAEFRIRYNLLWIIFVFFMQAF
jgi:hypothetical protein